MLKKYFLFGLKIFKSVIQKGQALAFFAIIFPLLFLCVAMAADFGWLYYNQSRLQNAADAAVIAGAKHLIFDEQSLSDYSHKKLVSNRDEDLLRLVRTDTISTRSTADGDEEVKRFLKYNLEAGTKTYYDGSTAPFKIVDISPLPGTKVERDSTPAQWNTIKFSHMLYGSDAQDFKALYYVITISEQLDHIFGDVIDYFNRLFPMKIPHLEARAVAVVKIAHVMIDPVIINPVVDPDDPNAKYHGPSLYQQMVELRNSEVYADWWEIKYEYDKQPDSARKEMFGTADTMTIARARSVQAKGNEYVDGNVYRTETLALHGWSIATEGRGTVKGNKMDQQNLDSLFLDLKVDKGGNFKDTDSASSKTNYNLNEDSDLITDESVFSNGITGKDVFKYRIHDMINIGKWNGSSYEYIYKVRPNKEPPDPLYVHIESEDNYVDGGSGNTVRQMIINVNATNKKEKTDRPMFIFYEGPEKYSTTDGKESKTQNKWKEDWRESWKYLGYYPDNDYKDSYLNSIRNSMPVIFNVNADFRGVLFMPNSPVVINGNQKTFTGFIVAERFLRLKKSSDFPDEITASSAKSKNYTYYKDGRDNEYYYKDFYYMVHHNANAEYYYNGKEIPTKRYIKVFTVKRSGVNKLLYGDVIYATGSFDAPPAEKLPEIIGDTVVYHDISKDDNIYLDTNGNYVVIDGSYVEVEDKTYIKVKPNAAVSYDKKLKDNPTKKYVSIAYDEYELYDENFQLKKDEEGNTITKFIQEDKKHQIKPTDRFIHYTYTLIVKEKAALLSTFSDYEQEYVYVYPMYVDQYGNVQYMPLDSNAVYRDLRPTPLDTEWHKDDVYEVIYKPETFNLNSVRYDSFGKIRLIDYTKLNDAQRYVGTQPLNDVFFTTIRSDWID